MQAMKDNVGSDAHLIMSLYMLHEKLKLYIPSQALVLVKKTGRSI